MVQEESMVQEPVQQPPLADKAAATTTLNGSLDNVPSLLLADGPGAHNVEDKDDLVEALSDMSRSRDEDSSDKLGSRETIEVPLEAVSDIDNTSSKDGLECLSEMSRSKDEDFSDKLVEVQPDSKDLVSIPVSDRDSSSKDGLECLSEMSRSKDEDSSDKVGCRDTGESKDNVPLVECVERRDDVLEDGNVIVVEKVESSVVLDTRRGSAEGVRKEMPPPAVVAQSAGVTDKNAMGMPSIVLQQADQDVCTELEVLQASSTNAGKASKLQLKLHPGTNGGVPTARKSPVTVQEWVDSLPAPLHRSEEESEDPPLDDAEDVLDLGLGAEAGLLYNVGCPAVTIISPQPPRVAPNIDIKAVRREGLAREPSVQSDVTSHGSHGSSVESYLESRKPDPEEVLMSLGFGGPGSSLDSEVSRIPRRFLQPSKVKGVAIKDFLRYQQDLIETFETGFCGYRGLTGTSHSMPSVIVAKIMEKLREHERENSPAASDHVSTPGSPVSPPPEASQRFSSIARRVMKRTSVLGAIPSKQPATLSVLNADNRRFLESQGNKSPEVPRKRMIIEHRSFTFGCDGEMIEVEASAPATPTPKETPPLPKPLLHKDSVLSSATSLSLTSADSDSDTDDRSSSYELQRRLRLPVTPGNSTETGPHCSTPYFGTHGPSLNLSKIPAMSLDLGAERIRTGKLVYSHSTIGKRMSSTSLSSWESDGMSPDSPVSRPRFPPGEFEPQDEYRSKNIRTPAWFYLPSSPDSPLGARPMRYESIDEDVEMRTDSDISKESDSNEFSSSSNHPISESENNQSCLSPSVPSDSDMSGIKMEPDDSVFTSVVTNPSLSRVSSIDETSSAHGRRGSLKRQQHIAEEEAIEILSAMDTAADESQVQNVETAQPLQIEENDIQQCTLRIPDAEEQCMSLAGIDKPEATSVLASQNEISQVEQETCVDVTSGLSPQEPGVHLQVARNGRGDSFEMEEIGIFEDEGRLATLSRTRSDSSGFLEGDPGERSPSNNSDSREAESGATAMEVENIKPNTVLPNITGRLRGGSGETSKNSDQLSKVDYVKRLSLPVVRVHDERGSILFSRSNSLHSLGSSSSCSSSSSSSSASTGRAGRYRRRSHSAPNTLSLGGSCSSVSNMFSSCSDESVIHVGVQKAVTASMETSESSPRNKDLQELLDELAGRGVNLTRGTDHPSLACLADAQFSPLQAEAVRLALGTYSNQLTGGLSSFQNRPELLECVPEAQRELQVVREIREQIAAELRRVASLLEEKPGPRSVAITRQMTALLREQTRLCHQLENLSQGTGDPSVPLSEPVSPPVNPARCCNSERLLGAVREENSRLERLVQGHSYELAEIRQLLRQLVARQS